jgi:hypothetical protein
MLDNPNTAAPVSRRFQFRLRLLLLVMVLLSVIASWIGWRHYTSQIDPKLNDIYKPYDPYDHERFMRDLHPDHFPGPVPPPPPEWPKGSLNTPRSSRRSSIG